MSENNYAEKISKIIDEFSKKFSDDGNNEFMIEFAERNLHEFVSDSDEIIRNLNCFTNDKSLKVAVYTYIFGLLFSSLNSDNSTVIDHINITLSIIGELLSEANDKIKSKPDVNRRERLKALASQYGNGVSEVKAANAMKKGQTAKVYKTGKIILGTTIKTK